MFRDNGRFTPFEKKVWLSSPTMHEDELKYMQEAYDTNWMSTVGENINQIEKQIAEKIGVNHAVGLSTGTAALHLAMKLAGLKIGSFTDPKKGALHGQRVFCSDMTFDATVNPVVYEGGIPVFIDTEYDTWNMDPVALEKAFELYPDVKLVVVAHLYGTPGKIDEIRAVCDKHGAVLIEDAAESLGATYKTTKHTTTENKAEGECVGSDKSVGSGECRNVNEYTSSVGCDGEWKQTGSFGDIGCISFNGNKIITGSAGGMLLTNSQTDANKTRKWSTQARDNAPWYQHEELGYNYRISNVIAGVVRGQIPYLDEHIKRKKEIYERYKEGFKDLPVSMNPYDEEKSSPNFWLSCLLIDEHAMCRHARGEYEAAYRPEAGKTCPTEILETLSKYNAEGRPIWKALHLQPIYRENGFVTREGNGRGKSDAYISGGMVGRDGKKLDVGADIFDRGVCLPSDIKMSAEEQDKVIKIVRSCFE